MKTNQPVIREIQSKDNQQIKKVIQDVLIEFGVPKVGTAYEDKALDDMFETYNKPTSAYYVIDWRSWRCTIRQL